MAYATVEEGERDGK
jgi:hypothetical protein